VLSRGRQTRRTSRIRAALVLFSLSSLASVRLPPDHQVPGHAGSAFESIRELIDGGQYAQAEVEAERTVSGLESVQAGPADHHLQAIDLLVEALVCNGKGAEARTRAFAQSVIQAREAQFGFTHPSLGPSLRNLGKVLIQAGEYQSAIPPVERAAAIHEQHLGGNQLELAEDLDVLVQGLTLIEKYDRALTTSDRTLDIKEKQLPATDIRIARTLEVRGLLLQRRGDYAGARRALERALTLRESANPEHPRIAETLGLLKDQHQFEGDLVGAQQLGEKALAVAERALRPDHPEIASYLRSLSDPVGRLGDLSRARALRERGLAIAEKALGPDHPLVGVQLNDLAVSFFTEGNYLRARALYERALRVYERRLGPDHSRVMTELYNLALVSDKLGDFPDARKQFDRVIKRWERVFGGDHPFVALVADALAESLSTQGLDAQARAWYERALAIRERILGKTHPDVARTLTRLSTSMARLGLTRQAYELSTRALSIWEQLSAGDTPSVAATLMVHGTVLADRGDYAEARASQERALSILRRIVGPSHPDVAEADVRLAATLAPMDQRIEALRNALEAEKIGRDHLRLMLRYLPERQGLEYAAKRPKGLDFALSLLASTLDKPDATQIFDEVVRSRGLVLDEMADRRHVAADAARPELAPLWTTLVSARQRFANLVIRGSSGLRGDQYATLLDQARREKELAERALADKSAALRDELAHGEIGLDEVRAALPERSALVAFVRYDRTILGGGPTPVSPSASTAPRRARRPVPSYAAVVVRSGDSNISITRLGSAAVIDSLVARWREESTGILRATSAREAEQAYRTAGAALRRIVWDPVAGRVKDAATLFVVPDGTLNLVSLATLPTGPTKYLIDQGPVIHYLSAERDLVTSGTASNTNRGLLAIGGAAFDDATLFTGAPSTSARKAASSQTTPAALARVRGSCGDLQTIRFEALTGTTREVREVARLWTESLAQVLERRDASERAPRAAPGHARILPRQHLHAGRRRHALGRRAGQGAAGEIERRRE
jgi:tetratricopeptide (TPR) repeat protein